MWQREGSGYQNLCCRFWELYTGLFELEIVTKRVNSGFWVCFYNNCIEKNQNKTHCDEGMCMHFILSGPHT